MTTLYLAEPHSFVTKRGATLVVRREGTGATTFPLERITEVVCLGDVSLSGAALRELASEGISLAYIGPRGEWVGRWEPAESKGALLRRAQFRAADADRQRIAIARKVVEGKLRNSRTLLLRARREGMLDSAKEIDAIANLIRRNEAVDSVDSIRGLEGEGAACYFRAYGRLISQREFVFERRARRPPPDPVNAMLSFGYALLTHVVGSAVRTVGFDAHVGFLHLDRYGRESLALDLTEEFRAPVVDALVAKLVHKQMVTPADFASEATTCTLRPEARKRYLEEFEQRLESELLHPVTGNRVSQRRAIELQARVLAKYLMGELPGYVPFCRR